MKNTPKNIHYQTFFEPKHVFTENLCCTLTSINMVTTHCVKQRTYVGGCAIAHFLFSNGRVGHDFFMRQNRKEIRNTKSRIRFSFFLRNDLTNK